MELLPAMLKPVSICTFTVLLALSSMAQDTIAPLTRAYDFKGQLSAWGHFNADNPYPLYLGGRYIPQFNYEIRLPDKSMFDLEASANLVGETGIHFFDSSEVNTNANAYRLWGRYSTEQLEIRVGLQKIDFGTALMLRSLRWFDQVDPRDPLQLTTGVYGILFRYYLLNNANLWVWGLYGNKNTKGMEVFKTSIMPEFGGRLQFPVPRGEAGLSYHNRHVDSPTPNGPIPPAIEVPENRLGLDAKFDLLVGLWMEAAWIHKTEDLNQFTNQEFLTLGSDYTFGIGSGLNVTLEHMLYAGDQKAFEFSTTNNTSALSFRYPIGMFDNISALLYYDWTHQASYNFVNWYRSFDRTTFYVMAYWNPENAILPTGGKQNLYGGKGIQLMFVYNH